MEANCDEFGSLCKQMLSFSYWHKQYGSHFCRVYLWYRCVLQPECVDIQVNYAVVEPVTSVLPVQHTDFSFWNAPSDAVLDRKFSEPSAVDTLGAVMFIDTLGAVVFIDTLGAVVFIDTVGAVMFIDSVLNEK